jgi:hypothetical protein
MSRIIAIGGGDVRKHTMSINSETIVLTVKKHSNMLYAETPAHAASVKTRDWKPRLYRT